MFRNNLLTTHFFQLQKGDFAVFFYGIIFLKSLQNSYLVKYFRAQKKLRLKKKTLSKEMRQRSMHETKVIRLKKGG